MTKKDVNKAAFTASNTTGALDATALEKIGLTPEQLIFLIKKSDLFSSMDEAHCKKLIQLTTLVILENNHVLFNQGDASDSMYFVVKGQLQAYTEVNKTPKIVGIIKQGEAVGELGVFSQKPRSLSIKSIALTVVLRLSRDHFIQFWEADTSTAFQMKMIERIVLRAQNVIKLLSNEKSNQHSVMLSLSDDPIPDAFIEQIKKNSNPLHLFILDDAFFANSPLTLERIKHLYIQADIEKKSLLFILSKTKGQAKNPSDEVISEEYQMILANSDNIYFLGCMDNTPQMSKRSSYITEKYIFPLTAKKFLVLLHKNSDALTSTNTRKWLELSHFSLHHHVRLTNDEDFKRLIRYIRDKPIGLVLSGGGSKGWAAIGVIKALMEENIPIDAIGGTSAGSIIATIFAIFQNYEDTYNLSKKMFHLGYEDISFANLCFPLVSLTNGKILTEFLQNDFANILAENIWIPNFSIACNLNTGEEVCQRTGLVWENIRASCSLPFIYPPMVRNGQIYVDGGLLNNLPVDQMQTLLGKQAFIIAVNVSPTKEDKTFYNFPLVMPFSTSILARIKLFYRNFKYPPLLTSLINSLLIGSSARAKANAESANLLIVPDLAGYPSLGVKPDKIVKLIEIGYQATKETIRKNRHLIPD